MQEILQHINSVEGVLGSAVFSEKGALLAHAFPALIDAPALKKAAALAVDFVHGLQISDTLNMLDLRYNEGRIIFRTFPGAILCLLCAKSINVQVLNITLNLAAKKLEKRLPAEMPPVAEEQPIIAAQGAEAENDGILRLKIAHLANREASSSFDSLGMVAISQPTASHISDYYKKAFKKLTLANGSAGTSGTFPVMVMNEMDPHFDGAIIVGPGIEKKLKANEGDKVEVRIP